MKFNIIVAFSKNNGIGINNTLPWHIQSDLIKFRILTTGSGNNAVIMGRNTWNSLPVKYLKNRDNLILSNTIIIDNNQTNKDNKKIYNNKSFKNINEIIDYCNLQNYDTVWIIGGSQIYKEFLDNKLIIIDKIYVTYIDKEFKCDTFFPNINSIQYKIAEECLHITNNRVDNLKIYDRIYHKI